MGVRRGAAEILVAFTYEGVRDLRKQLNSGGWERVLQVTDPIFKKLSKVSKKMCSC